MKLMGLYLIAGIIFVGVLSGCSGGAKGPPTVQIKGKVTLDGTPLEKGSIVFEPKDGKGSSAGGTIQNGEYVADVQPGNKIVRITSSKVVGKKKVYEGDPDSPEEDVVAELVPPMYNNQSTLEKDVGSAKDDVNFDLSTKTSAN